MGILSRPIFHLRQMVQYIVLQAKPSLTICLQIENTQKFEASSSISVRICYGKHNRVHFLQVEKQKPDQQRAIVPRPRTPQGKTEGWQASRQYGIEQSWKHVLYELGPAVCSECRGAILLFPQYV